MVKKKPKKEKKEKEVKPRKGGRVDLRGIADKISSIQQRGKQELPDDVKRLKEIIEDQDRRLRKSEQVVVDSRSKAQRFAMEARSQMGIAKAYKQRAKIYRRDGIVRSRLAQKALARRTKEETIFGQLVPIGSEEGLKFFEDRKISRRAVPFTGRWWFNHFAVWMGGLVTFVIFTIISNILLRNLLVALFISLFLTIALWLLLYYKVGVKNFLQSW